MADPREVYSEASADATPSTDAAGKEVTFKSSLPATPIPSSDDLGP